MLVRVATREDSNAIAALHAASWQATYRNILSDDYLDQQVLEDRSDLWAARFAKFDPHKHHVAIAVEADEASPDKESLSGFVCVLLDEEPEHGALLDNLHVAPDRHGRGAGRCLMRHAAQWVATKQPDWPMHLWVYEDNRKTVAFYRSIGGEEADRRLIVTPAGNRAVVMRFEWAHPGTLARLLTATLQPSDDRAIRP